MIDARIQGKEQFKMVRSHKILIDDLLKVNPAPDKAANQMGWIQHMNMLKMQAEEIILRELIYM